MTRPLILDTAMEVVDELGFDAVTMRAVAQRLGVVPMALYRHVADKAELVDAVLNRAMARVHLPAETTDWRTSLSDLGRSIRTTLLAHPGMVAPLLERPRLGINALVIREFCIAALRRAGLPGHDAERGTALLLVYVIGFVALEVPRRAAGYHPDGSNIASLDAAFDLPREQFPNTVELRTRAGEFVSDAQFEFGLARLLDGLDPRHR